MSQSSTYRVEASRESHADLFVREFPELASGSWATAREMKDAVEAGNRHGATPRAYGISLVAVLPDGGRCAESLVASLVYWVTAEGRQVRQQVALHGEMAEAWDRIRDGIVAVHDRNGTFDCPQMWAALPGIR